MYNSKLASLYFQSFVTGHPKWSVQGHLSKDGVPSVALRYLSRARRTIVEHKKQPLDDHLIIPSLDRIHAFMFCSYHLPSPSFCSGYSCDHNTISHSWALDQCHGPYV
jgi:hypothetical protein